MTPELDEELVQRVNDLGTSRWSGTAYRHTAANRDPLSGSGAALFGGRWNPVGIAAVYLASPAAACMAELDRAAQAQGLTADDLLRAANGRTMHTIRVHELDVLDLREEAPRSQVGLDLDDISSDDWTACQAVGQAAHFLRCDGVLAPSAAGTGLVVTAFESRINAGQLEPERSERLTDVAYARLRLSGS